MKRFLKVILLLILLSFLFVPTLYAANEVKVYFFYGNDCPHCAKEEEFLKKIVAENSSVKVYSFEVWHNKGNLSLLAKIGEEMNLDVSGIPVTIIGEWGIVGYLNDQTTGQEIEKQIRRYQNIEYPDVIGQIIEKYEESLINQNQNQNVNQNNHQNNQLSKLPEKLRLPVFGDLNIRNVSLPVLTVMIGALDGFNPCAMWALVFLIGLLINMDNSRKRWLLGLAFILASAAVYFIFVVAWLNFILFIGLVIWVRIIIGLVAIISGGVNLRDYYKKQSGVCKVTKSEQRRKIIEKLIAITQHNKFWFALVGIIILAFAVNLIELVCSAGFPAVYTQILALSKLSTISYYLYILLYIFIFMLDDMIVFIVAMLTLKATGLTGKYSKWSNLIGGILMVLLGILLIFKPGILMFG